MLCLRARLPRQSADSLRRTRIQGFAHKLPCRRQKKHALHALRRSAALKGSCAKVFPALCREGLAICRGVSKVSATRRMTPLRCRCALHRKRELCLCGNMQFYRGGAALASPFGVNGRLTASEQKQLGARKKGARGAPPFGLPVGTRTRNNAVGGHRFIQLDYG